MRTERWSFRHLFERRAGHELDEDEPAAFETSHVFRADLFDRLSVFPIRIPPLRERRDDIRALVHFFLSKYQDVHDKRVSGFTDNAQRALRDYDYPGNVRELENMIERGVVPAPANKPIDVRHLLLPRERIGGSFTLDADGNLRRSDEVRVENEGPAMVKLIDGVLESAVSFEALERTLLERAVEQAEGNLGSRAHSSRIDSRSAHSHA